MFFQHWYFLYLNATNVSDVTLWPNFVCFPSPQKSKHTESEKLQVQIQAYLDNVFDVGGLLEDAETKNVALEKVEELEEHLSHVGILQNSVW